MSNATATQDVAISKIMQIAVPVKDIDRAVVFYRDTLGLRFIAQVPPGLAFFDCGGVRLMLSPPEGTEFDRASIIYYDVPDIKAAHAALVARGVKFEGEPHMIGKLGNTEVWLAPFRDSEGNYVAIMSENPA